LRQLDQASAMYSSDNNGYFVLNGEGQQSDQYVAWVQQWLNYSGGGSGGTDDTNMALLTGSSCMLSSYLQNPAVFKSPLDISKQYGLSGAPRNRSYSMNGAIACLTNSLASGTNSWLPSGTFKIFTRENQVTTSIGPSDLFIFLEEHPDSINDGFFAVQMPQSALGTTWIDVPAKNGNVCPFAFVDGHAEIHKWLSPGNIPNITWVALTKNGIPELGDRDILWVAKHTTVYANGGGLPY
jgi:prepilin-type processing-associated H-X9-DG protein